MHILTLEAIKYSLSIPRFVLVFFTKYFVKLRIAFHEFLNVTGFCILLVFVNQIVSGYMLAISLSPDPMYIPLVREEEDLENLFTDDFFFLHERGVDLTVLLLFTHLLRKLYVNATSPIQQFAWKSGVMLFLGVQFVIFTGLTLCCTHLSDITLGIAVNAFHSATLFVGKLYWLIFPDQSLNIDTTIRLAYLHYIFAVLLGYFSTYHGVDMHYDWKPDEAFLGIKQELDWYDEALINEVGQCLDVIIAFGLACYLLYTQPDALNYEIFMWGDVGMQVDIRYFGVAPHWYFRPYMAWLISCPSHYAGLAGLIVFFVGFYYQPNILALAEGKGYTGYKALLLSLYFYIRNASVKLTVRISALTGLHVSKELFYQVTFATYVMCIIYAFSYLPYGRFFNRLGGNDSSLLAFFYIFLYMSLPILRIPHLYNLSKLYSV